MKEMIKMAIGKTQPTGLNGPEPSIEQPSVLEIDELERVVGGTDDAGRGRGTTTTGYFSAGNDG